MRNTKIGRFFSTLIYTVLLTIPMLSVLVRVIYVQSNHNAKDSYFGNTINEEILTPSTINSLVPGNSYTFSFHDLTTFTTSSATDINVTDLSIVGNNLNNTYESARLRFYVNTSGYLVYQVTGSSSAVANNVYMKFDFVSLSLSTSATNDVINNYLYLVTYNDYSYLDNAFDYSIYKVVEEYGTGNINFVNWFGLLFFTNTNQLYFNFVNMYLNYALYISACYLFYLILSWFIKFITNLIENSFLDKARKE